jgi:hypothetical protein
MALNPTAITVVLAILAALVAWLSVEQLRARRDRWVPVYRKLRDGRLQFKWYVNDEFQDARRRAADGETDPS